MPSKLSLSLSAVKIRKAIGPDFIPNRIVKEFVQELAPVFRDIHNPSLFEGYFPDALKATHYWTQFPRSLHHNGLRAIYGLSLWGVPLQGLGGFYPCSLIVQVSHQIDLRQYERAGHSPTDALVHLLQAVYEAVDMENVVLGSFLLITQRVLIWLIIAFFRSGTQAVRIENTFSEWKSPKGDIPQGTKLGVILFIIMTNNLLHSWNLRIKFVDDTTAFEIIPRNTVSSLNFAINDLFLKDYPLLHFFLIFFKTDDSSGGLYTCHTM